MGTDDLSDFRKPITTTILIEDQKFIKENGLLVSNLIHERVGQLRVNPKDEISELELYKERTENLHHNFQQAIDYLNGKGEIDDFLRKVILR